MGFTFIKKLPTPSEIREQYPISEEIQKIKEQRAAQIRDAITGVSDKFLVIVGPCSADNEDALCDYVSRLAELQEEVNERLIPVSYTHLDVYKRQR